MGDIISMKEYKREHSIALPRSPYYTLDATPEQLNAAYKLAVEEMKKPFDFRGLPPYAVIVGYENIKTGKIKLLKGIHTYSTKEAFITMAGIRGYYCVGLLQKSADKGN